MNFVRNHLISHERHEAVVQEVVVDILQCFDPYFSPAYSPYNLGVDPRPLMDRVSQLVQRAHEIALHMKSADCMTWTFWGIPGQLVRSDTFGFDSVIPHEADVSMPRQNRGAVGPMSTVSLCVVPGLSIFHLQRAEGGLSTLESVICRPAKAFVDLQYSDVGPDSPR